MTIRAAILAAFALLPQAAFAEGFLVGRMEKVPDLTLNTGEAGFEFEPKEPIQLETGKGYRWWIKGKIGRAHV